MPGRAPLVQWLNEMARNEDDGINNWQNDAVPQRRQSTGCIPWGYEMMLRAAGAKGIDYSTFQDEFDLDSSRTDADQEYRNNVGSIANEIARKYPSVEFSFYDSAGKGSGEGRAN
jgi:hypothetical protein